MRRKEIVITVVIVAVVSACVGLASHQAKNAGKQSPLGLKLVAKYEPLHLYIYADTTSTNRLPDYLICEGNNDLVFRANTESNTIETTHFENGDGVLMTERNDNGKLLKRTVSYNDDLGKMQYTYIDNNGDGLWDFFFDETKRMYYVRSNLCWVLRHQDYNQNTNNPTREEK